MSCLRNIPAGNRYVGDPVDVITGANVDVSLEFRLSGTVEFVWRRYYNSSHCGWHRALGWGHTHEYDHELRLDVDGIRYTPPQGEPVEFDGVLNDGDSLKNGAYRLTRISGASYELQHSGSVARFIFTFPRGSARADLTELRLGAGSIHFHYGKHGLEEIELPARKRISVSTDNNGRIRSLTLLGSMRRQPRRLIAYEYDQSGNLISGVDPYGSAFSFQYNQQNRMMRRTDRNGYSMLFDYDSQGRCVRAGGEDGVRRVQLRYAPMEQLTTVTEADGGEWTYFFNDSGQITQIINPVGGAQRFEFDKSGVLQTESDPLGNLTRYVYSSDGELVSKVSPIGIRYGIGDATPPPFRPHNLPKSPRQFEFGDLQGPIAGSNGFTAVNGKLRPELLRALSGALPNEVQATTRDEFGKTLKQTTRSGAIRRWGYDANGNILRHRDFSGADYHFQYSSWNHRVREIGPEGQAVESRYTASEKLSAVKDAGGTEQTYDYNFLGKVAEVHRHGELLESYEYDPAGNLVLKRDCSGTPLLRFEIAPGNLIGARHLSSGDIHRFEYDAPGRILRAASEAGDAQFAYDEAGRRIKDFRSGQGVAHLFEDDEQETTVLGRFKIFYRKQSDGTVRITDCTGETHRVSFPARDVSVREHTNGSREYTRFDGDGRVHVKIVHQKQLTFDHWVRRYSWSEDGDLLAEQDSILGSTAWAYDRAHRLKQATLPDGSTQAFSYDAAGNLLQAPGLSGVTLQNGNRLASANGDRFDYNNRDHVSKRVGQHGDYSYFYDSRDMLVRIERTGKPDWESSYDALARRVSKTDASGKTRYFWDTDRLAAEVDPAGRLRIYIYLDALALTPFMFVDYDSVDADPSSGSAYFLFSNHLGAPVLIEDRKGRIVWQCSYTAYGRAQIEATSSIVCNLRFPGHYFDHETGLHYNRFRYYSPELGRYLQCDPEGISGGLNLYAYTRNPLVEVDIRGLSCGGHSEQPNAKAKPDCEDCRNADPALKEALTPTEPGAIRTPAELRAETVRREQVVRDKVSGNDRGPCVSMVLDQESGQAFPGINRDHPPENPHPLIKDRIDNPPAGGWPEDNHDPGSHGEVHALNDALWAREKNRGLDPGTLTDTDGLLIDNQRSRGANKGTPMPCCRNCTHITGDVPSQTGKTPVSGERGETGEIPSGGDS
jgi:RHS repeat-associated protein